MNNLIQELAEQAKNSIPSGTLGVDVWIQAYNKKFADLILADVLAIVAPKHDGRTEVFRAHRNLFNQIKQHFELDPVPCEHEWIVNHHIMSNGWLCDKCYDVAITNPKSKLC